MLYQDAALVLALLAASAFVMMGEGQAVLNITRRQLDGVAVRFSTRGLASAAASSSGREDGAMGVYRVFLPQGFDAAVVDLVLVDRSSTDTEIVIIQALPRSRHREGRVERPARLHHEALVDGVAGDLEGRDVAAVDDDANRRAAPRRRRRRGRRALRAWPQRHLTSTSSSQVPARSVVPSAVKVMVAGLLSVQ